VLAKDIVPSCEWAVYDAQDCPRQYTSNVGHMFGVRQPCSLSKPQWYTHTFMYTNYIRMLRLRTVLVLEYSKTKSVDHCLECCGFKCVVRSRQWLSAVRTDTLYFNKWCNEGAGALYSLGQKWKTWTGRQYFTDILGLSSTTVI